jgi:hypothetical protein
MQVAIVLKGEGKTETKGSQNQTRVAATRRRNQTFRFPGHVNNCELIVGLRSILKYTFD